MKKKEIENTALAVIGIGLIVTSIILLSKRSKKLKEEEEELNLSKHYMDYGDTGRGLHVFSESGILL